MNGDQDNAAVKINGLGTSKTDNSKGSAGGSKRPEKDKKKDKDRFRYGNYNQYYGTRLETKFQRDPRLALFNDEWFRGKAVLDVGCNIGIVTILLAKEFEPRRVVGIDIDPGLIGIARKNIRHYCDADVKFCGKLPGPSTSTADGETPKFPDNVWFIQGNYVLEADEMLEMVVPEYNVILALSITKWIHLNWGDAGLKRFFKRVYLHLKPGGRFIMEPQAFETYAKRARLGNDDMKKHFSEIQLKPDQFNDFLLNTVGFREAVELGTPEAASKAASIRPNIMKRDSSIDGSPDNADQQIQQLKDELQHNNIILNWHKDELRRAGNQIEELKSRNLNESFGGGPNFTTAQELSNQDHSYYIDQIADLTRQLEAKKRVDVEVKEKQTLPILNANDEWMETDGAQMPPQNSDMPLNANDPQDADQMPPQNPTISNDQQTEPMNRRKRPHFQVDKDAVITNLQRQLEIKNEEIRKFKNDVMTKLKEHGRAARKLLEMDNVRQADADNLKKELELKDKDLAVSDAQIAELKSKNQELAGKVKETETKLRASVDVKSKVSVLESKVKEQEAKLKEANAALISRANGSGASASGAVSNETSTSSAWHSQDKILLLQLELCNLEGKLKTEELKRKLFEKQLPKTETERSAILAQITNELDTAVRRLRKDAGQCQQAGKHVPALQRLSEAMGIEMAGGKNAGKLFDLATEKAQNFSALKQYPMAAKWYTQALKCNIDNSTTLLRRAQAYLAMRQFDKALSDVQQCLNENPNSKEAKAMKANIERNMSAPSNRNSR